jgi:hypothetical protein
VIGTVLALALPLAIAHFSLGAVLCGRTRVPWALRLGLTLGGALGVSGFSFLFLLFVHGAWVGADTLVEIGLLAAALRLSRSQSSDPTRLAREDTHAFVAFWLAGTAAVALAHFVVDARLAPHGQWDAWAIWNMKARLFARDPSRWKVIFDGRLLYAHGDYPLLLPAIIGRLLRALASESAMIPRAVALAFAAGTALVVGGAVAATRSPTLGCLAAWFVLTGPLPDYAAMQYADVPVGFFFAAAVALLLLADLETERRRSLLVTAGAFAGFALLTKNEGTLFLVALLATRIVQFPRPSQIRRLATELGSIAAGSAPALLLSAWHRHLGKTNELLSAAGADSVAGKLTSLQRYSAVANAFADQFRALDGWMLVLLGVAMMTGSGDPPRRSTLAGLAVLTGVLVTGYFLVFIVTPYDLVWHLASSSDRLAVQLQPLMILSLFYALPARLGEQFLGRNTTGTSI